MSIIDAFRGDAFSAQTLTAAVERTPFNPTGVGQLGLFTPKPVATVEVAVEFRNGSLVVIPTSKRGSPGKERETERRTITYLETPRLRHSDTITGNEMQSVRAFGQENLLVNLEQEVARRVSGPTGLQASMEMTWEYHRLGALNGLVLDADGGTLYDFFSIFGLARPAEIDFDLDDATPEPGELRRKCNETVRSIIRSAKGMATGPLVGALCGDEFFDKLITHPEVRETYLAQEEASDLRTSTDLAAFGSFNFGGIRWMNYRGTDDNTTVAVPSAKTRLFPMQAPEVFQVAFAPGETLDTVNKPGLPLYMNRVFDNRDEPEWVRFEASSYPLHMCVRPEVLRTGKISA